MEIKAEVLFEGLKKYIHIHKTRHFFFLLQKCHLTGIQEKKKGV